MSAAPSSDDLSTGEGFAGKRKSLRGNPNPRPPKRKKSRHSARDKKKKGEDTRNSAARAARGRTQAVVGGPLLKRGRSKFQSQSNLPLQRRPRLDDEIRNEADTIDSEEGTDDKDTDSDYEDQPAGRARKEKRKNTSTSAAAKRRKTTPVTTTREQVLASEKEKQDNLELDKTTCLDSLEEKCLGKSKQGEGEKDVPTDRVGRRMHGREGLRQRRQAINYFFSTVCRSPPESSGLWDGRNGIIARIRKFLLLPPGYNAAIKRTLELILLFKSKKEKYIGQRKPKAEWTHYYIPKDSCEAQLIADLIEQDMGFRETTKIVNECRESLGKFPVGMSCVYQTCKRLKPVVTTVKKRQQGSFNLESVWCKASHRWSCQILILLGELRQDQAPHKFYVEGKMPRCFDYKELRLYKLICIQFWDETHKQQRVGKVRSGTRKQYQFPRNECGGVDPDNGKPAERETELKMKYEKEARFMTGMCLELDDDGNVKKDELGRPLGIRLPLLEYTEQKVVSHRDWMDAWVLALKAPRDASDTSRWVQNTRDKKKKHKGDPVTTLPGINDEAADWLESRMTDDFPNGVRTVGEYFDFFYGKQGRRTSFVKAMKRAKVRMSNEIQVTAEALAEKAEPGVPKIIDHRNNPNCRNPWKSRFGKDWETKLRNSSQLKKLVCVRELVKHMVEVGEKTYKGTKYEHEWGFYHDALSLMNSYENLEWMKSKGYLKYWTLPQNDLNSMFSYHKKPMPVGNHAGAMPWDQSCNKDHDDIVLHHVAATSGLTEDDERKFSLRSPKKVASAHKRKYLQ